MAQNLECQALRQCIFNKLLRLKCPQVTRYALKLYVVTLSSAVKLSGCECPGMTDPYRAPEADLLDEAAPSKVWWKVFFWLLLILEALSITAYINDPAESVFEMLLEIAIYSAILVGMFGFAYDKKILSQGIWKIVLPIGLAYDIYVLIDIVGSSSPQTLYLTTVSMVVIVFPVMLFQYIALYKYGFKSTDIWN